MDEARQVVDMCEKLGVELWLDGTELRFRAPAGVMTPSRLGALRARKPEVVALLRDESAAAVVSPDPGRRYEPFPLTDIQAAYVVGRGAAVPYGGLGCHGYGELHTTGLDVDRLRAAWHTLTVRHDALRLRIGEDGVQRVLPPGEPEPIDVGVTDAAGFAAAVTARRDEMDHRVYDPYAGPLTALAVTHGPDESVLHLSVDFLVADFVSLRVLLDELEREYDRPGSLGPAPRVTFRDCVVARRRAAGTRRRAAGEHYWQGRLASLPGPPELPVLPAAEALPRFGRLRTTVDGPRWAAFRARAAAAGLTVNTAVLAAYAEVVRKWSSRPEFTLAVTVLARPAGHPDVARVVGDFTTVELLALDPAGATLRERAAAVQARLADDLEHGTYTGIDVIRELRRRDPAANALFPVVFTSSVGSGGVPGAGPGRFRLGHGISQTPQVWLDCQVMETPDGLQADWDHRLGVFEPGVVETMFEAFARLLGAMADGDPIWRAPDPVTTPAAQLARRPRPDTGPAPADLLHAGVLRVAAATPERTAVVTPGRTLGYGELVARATAVAAAAAGLGVRPGDRVAIEMEKGWEQVVAAVGVLMAGAAYVPVDRGQPAARRLRIIDNVDARLVLTQSWAESSSDRPRLDVDLLPPAPPAAPAPIGPDAVAYVIHTSGTTGVPKGVVIRHAAAWNTLADVNERYRVGDDTVVLGLASLGFDLSVFDVFGVLGAGGRLVLPDPGRRNDPAHWAELMREHRITHWNSVPAQMEMLLSYAETDATVTFPALRQVLLSGDWVPPALAGRIAARAGSAAVHSLGGATEASVWSIAHPMDDLDPSAATVPYGRALRHQTVRVLDHRMLPAPDLVTGEIWIGGAGVAAGYHGSPELTADRFRADPHTGDRVYRTGDLGRYLPNGDIEFLGRRDSQVKIRGHRIELGEIEAALEEHPAVNSAVVVATKDGGPPQLTAFVGAAAGESPPEPGIAAAIGERAARDVAPMRAAMDTGRMLRFAREMDRAGLIQMLATLRAAGLFATPDDSHDIAEILEVARVAPRHRRLVRRWVTALTRHGLLSRGEATGRYSRLSDVGTADVDAAWERIATLMEGVEQRTELADYFHDTARRLPELMRGELDPLEQLFPAGRTEIHEVAYNGIFLSHYLNQLLVRFAVTLAEGGPLTVLEIGGGVGGTSVELIPALAGHDVRYTFTDVSRFFLNNARERFASHGFLDYRLYDMNAGYWAQGLRPNTYSMVVCANVLHYAKDVNVVLGRIRELLAPGGWLLLIEATHDNHQIMTSMEFLFDEKSGEFQDVRGEQEQTFLSEPQWVDALTRAGADSLVRLPARDPITDEMGMHVFAARFKSATAEVRRDDLAGHLRSRLPEHMLPAQLHVLDRLPLTANGKVDRALLSSLAADGPRSVAAAPGEPPAGPLEEAIAAIYRAKLDRADVGRADPFFELGGDSLLAAQIAAAVRTDVPAAASVPFDRLLRVVFENASVARLAEEVEAAAGMPAGPAADQVGELVSLADGTGPAVVLLPDRTGRLECYGGLAPAAGVPLLGIQVKDERAYLEIPADLLVERLAEHYAGLLTDAGRLRVSLVGHEFGALVAVELARRLSEDGLVVERLVLSGGVPPFGSPDGDAIGAHSTASADDWMLLPYAGDVTVVGEPDPAVEAYWADVCLGDLTLTAGTVAEALR